MHVLLISPVSSLPTIVSMQSLTYPELMQAGYQATNFGTKKEMQELEAELLSDFCNELEYNETN